MRAIVAPYDKSGLVEFAQGLVSLGWELFATGGTEKKLRAAGIAVTPVAELTGVPEMLGGRVKTLHPKVHGGILYRRGHPGDEADVEAHGLSAIDMVVGGLYPFVETVTGEEVTLAAALEEIDIGGPTMIRAAAKNHPWVIPIVDPDDYPSVLEALRAGELDGGQRRALAAKAFAHVSHYDAAIAEYLRGEGDPFPAQLTVGMTRREVLRYGENPHQQGALYTLDSVRTPVEGVGGYTQHHGKAMSYVNVLDADAAYNLVAECEQPAVAIIKHTNPCCFASGDASIAALYEQALLVGDAVSAYGGIVATNRPIDLAYATALRNVLSPATGGRMFFEIVIAPGYDDEGLAHLQKKSKDLRILTVPEHDPQRPRLELRSVRGGMLVQDSDLSEERDFEVMSERVPSDGELSDLHIAWHVAKHVKSNAIVLVKDGVLVGMGAGQPNRVESARLACAAAGERAQGAALASDAFFPFPDSLEVAAAAGVTAAVHPGGSIRDDDSVAAANRLGMSLLTTGARHFRH